MSRQSALRMPRHKKMTTPNLTGKMSNYDVFISYSRRDRAIVDEICGLLDAESISYWVDRKRTHPGSMFMEDIVNAIKNSRITLFVSSSDSNKSVYIAKEIAIAFNEGKYIIPYKVDMSPFNERLEFVLCDLNWVEAVPYSTQKAVNLVADIKALLHGERAKEMEVQTEKREYIDVLKWNEPRSGILKFFKRVFEDKS